MWTPLHPPGLALSSRGLAKMHSSNDSAFPLRQPGNSVGSLTCADPAINTTLPCRGAFEPVDAPLHPATHDAVPLRSSSSHEAERAAGLGATPSTDGSTNPMNALSLTQRLIGMIFVRLILLWVAITALFVTYGTQLLAGSTRDQGLAIVSFLAPATEYGIISGNQSSIERILEIALVQAEVASAAVLGADGELIVMRGRAKLLDRFEPVNTQGPQLVSGDVGRLAFAAPVNISPVTLDDFPYPPPRLTTASNTPVPVGWVYVELDTGALTQQPWQLVLLVLLISLVTLALTALPAIRLVRRIGTRVAKLADTVSHLADGEYDVPIPAGAQGSELQALERSLSTVAKSMANAHQLTQARIDEATAHLRHLALHDPLTGLLNRRAFDVALEEAVSASRRADDHGTLCCLDLDHFKLINDVCGHAAGDALLQSIAGLISSRVRAVDMIYRIGGDEFAIILRRCSSTDALRIAEGLCEAIAEYRFLWSGNTFQIGASIGLARIDDPAISTTAVLKAADVACYGAKRNGRSRVNEHHQHGSDRGD